MKKKHNILIIGLGKRVRGSILPALSLLTDYCEVAGVVSRKQNSYLYKGKIHTSLTDLSTIDFKNIDIVIVAVTLENVASVVRNLSQYDVGHIRLYLDTPVIDLSQYTQIGFFRFFKDIYVSEDYVSMSDIIVLREIISSKILGSLQHIYLIHSAYKYHGLATLKTLCSTKYVVSIHQKLNKITSTETQIVLPRNMQATIIGPRDYSIGKYLLCFEKGYISDYLLNVKNSIFFDYQVGDSTGAGFKIFHKNTCIYKHEHHLDDSSRSKLENLKIEALARMYKNGFYDLSAFNYSFVDALYDHIVSKYSEEHGSFFDFTLFGSSKSAVYYLIELSAKILNALPISLLKIINKIEYFLRYEF